MTECIRADSPKVEPVGEIPKDVKVGDWIFVQFEDEPEPRWVKVLEVLRDDGFATTNAGSANPTEHP